MLGCPVSEALYPVAAIFVFFGLRLKMEIAINMLCDAIKADNCFYVSWKKNSSLKAMLIG
jgi:hypothetical protein